MIQVFRTAAGATHRSTGHGSSQNSFQYINSFDSVFFNYIYDIYDGLSQGWANRLMGALSGALPGALLGAILMGAAADSAMAQPSREMAQFFQRIAQPSQGMAQPSPIARPTAALPTPLPAKQIAANPITQPAQPQVRSIWLDRETIVKAGSKQGLAQVFERFKAAGINTVFVETVNAGYPIYPSSVAPQQNPLIKGWDPLQASVELGKTHGIKVHAWVWLFAAGNQAHNPLVGKPANYPGPVISAHPDWAGFDNHGNLIIPGQTKTFLDPANPEVRQYLFDLLSEIAERYDVDGIQFDYIRYPFQDLSANRLFGYGNAARRQFHQLTGTDPITLSPQNRGDQRQAYLWDQWTAFRTQQISSFVGEASRRLRRQKPGLTLSAAVFADDTTKRRQTLQQDWEDWADQGLVDWIVLMSYASNTQRFAELIRPWVVESSYRSTVVIPGIRLLNLPAAVASDQLQLLQDLSTSGYALFAADNLNSAVQQMLVSAQAQNRQTAALR
jgi:uncharacterized lipoprotein YddW (UPF0748 family)